MGKAARARLFRRCREWLPVTVKKLAIAVNHLLTLIGEVVVVTGEWSLPALGVSTMGTNWIYEDKTPGSFAGPVHAADESAADMLVASCLAAAAQGDINAYYDLGVAFSTGSHGAECDLVEAHKWFNLAAVSGHAEAGSLP